MEPEVPDRDAELENRVLALCDEVLAQPSEERAGYLRRRCEGQPGLRAGVESVLRAIDDSGRFLRINPDDEDL